jgi:hypothetical protein
MFLILVYIVASGRCNRHCDRRMAPAQVGFPRGAGEQMTS